MVYFTKFKLLNFISIFIAVLSMPDVLLAGQKNIYTTSVNLNDNNSKEKLLSSIPKWNYDVIKSLFAVYKNPKKYQLPIKPDSHIYNIQFINAFWGPIENPFNKYPRPAKVFVMFDSSLNNKQTLKFYMAPIVKSDTDGNDYVFDNKQSQPMLLKDWIATLQQNNNLTNAKFNICNGYGNFPSDSCTEKSYQDESRDTGFRAYNLKNYVKSQSSLRDIHEDWKTKVPAKLSSAGGPSIYYSSVSWADEAKRNKLLKSVTTWANYKVIKENFNKIRDIRYFSDTEKPNFLRRISWLYPDDGCWTRASAVIRDLFGPFNFSQYKLNESARPSKVFVFGNLCVNTPNAPGGAVAWWYHTSPIIRDAETNITYVLDPSVNPQKPLPMQEWVNVISSNTQVCSRSGVKNSVSDFNICTGYGSTPNDTCDFKYFNETASMLGQPSFQSEERLRLNDLNRDADAELGDLPPWKNA